MCASHGCLPTRLEQTWHRSGVLGEAVDKQRGQVVLSGGGQPLLIYTPLGDIMKVHEEAILNSPKD